MFCSDFDDNIFTDDSETKFLKKKNWNTFFDIFIAKFKKMSTKILATFFLNSLLENCFSSYHLIV